MVHAAVLQSQIDDALARGGTVLVPSQRAALGVRRDLLMPGPAGLEQPRILSWGAWTSRLWHGALLSGATDRLLLNRTQEQTLWRELIGREPAVSSLRDPNSLARLTAEAWRELAEHRGLRRLAGSATNADTETFARLATVFEQVCRRDGYLPEAELAWALRQVVLAKRLDVEDTELLVCGFDRLLPAQQALLDALEESGVTVAMLPPGEPARDRRLLAVEDEREELKAAAAWCRTFVEEQPEGRAAVLVPGLREDGRAARVERVFRAVLAPGAESITVRTASLPYEIVYGLPLAETAVVSGALDLLMWTVGPLEFERVGCLLLSPYLTGGEAGARAEFDAFEVRRARVLRPEVDLEWMVRRLGRSARRDRLGGLLAGLRAMQTVMRRRLGPEERKPWGEWAEAARELLRAAGWAREAAVDAGEFETRRAWESLLDELATLDFAGGRVEWEQAVHTLRGLAAETMHAVPFRDARVQVMTPEDAEGMSFDAVWFLRAGDVTWPLPGRSSPLLGRPLKRELGMPGADPAADQARARLMTARVVRSAGTVVFSYARELAEETQRVSPVLAGLGLQAMAAEPDDATDEPMVELEAVADRSRISLSAAGPIRGGAAVLQAQAACGFRAFAERRLFATGLEAREPGMDARERGDAVHRVLERFWEGVETQATLRGMTADERDARLAASIDFALAGSLDDAGTRWDHAYLETQRQRLMTLGRRWLEIEAARGVPFRVARRESETRDVAIGPLRLSLRVDRIDQTEHGAVLIDYKTGKAGAADWVDERPNEPQLPLYAVLAGEPLHAIAFGAIRPGKYMELTGYESQPGTLTKPVTPKAESLEAQIEAWEQVLTQLASDFWSGDARVLPKEFPSTCRYCKQRLLCRLDPATLTEEEDDEAAGPGEFEEEEIPG